MPYRLPLELELTILELAAPPLAIDSLHDRVAFFINASLVHRSLTAWAQERLRDQFLYTYRARPDEHKRLKRRFEAGFGRDRPLRRLYLDLTRLPEKIDKRKKPGSDSVSATINGRVYVPVSSIGGPGRPKQTGASAREQACEPVAHYVQPGTDPNDGHWELCTMITKYAQALDTLWLKLPLVKLEIPDLPPPRILLLDDDGANVKWGWFGTLPLSSETVLFLRNIGIDTVRDTGDLDTRHLVFDRCWWADSFASDLLVRFHQLETLVLFETESYDLAWLLANLPTTIRRVHLLQQGIRIDEDCRNTSIVLPRLESFTFTWLRPDREPQRLADANSDALTDMQETMKSLVDAPLCTFKYLRSTKWPEHALAEAMEELKLDV